MIVFHNDHLAPAGFCDLLYDFIPRELHTPVVFTARGGGSGKWLAKVHHRPWGDPARYRVHLRLDRIYWSATFRSPTSSIAAELWRMLLHVALHEFGHVATRHQLDEAVFTPAAYRAAGPQGYGYVEKLANDWADMQIDRLLDFDARLAQPSGFLTGYLGARHAKIMRRLPRSSHRLVAEIRCTQTGGQLTAGHILRNLGVKPTKTRRCRECGSHLAPRYATRDYVALRAIGPELGIPYSDAIGRKHYLYTWGDLRELKRRYAPLLPEQAPMPPVPARAPAPVRVPPPILGPEGSF
jgi:hypothetical protein